MKPGLRALTIGFLAAFLVAVAGTGAAIYIATLGTIQQLVDRRIENVSALVDDNGTSLVTILARIDALAGRRDTGDIGFLLTDAGGRRIGGNVAVSRRFPSGFTTLRKRDGILGLSAGRAFARPLGAGMILTTMAETEPFDGYRAARLRIYLIGFGSMIVIVLAGLLAFTTTIRRRFAATRHTVAAIIAGDMQRRVPVGRSTDEFDRQAHAFNQMLDRIAILMDSLRTVSNDVAHDLRTPLAGLRSRLATIAARDSASRADIELAIEQCDAMLAMFTAMLRIAEVEDGRRTDGFATIDLTMLMTDVAEAMAPVAEESGHRFRLAALPPIRIVGDARLIEQALINGIENALRHTPTDTTIKLAAELAGDEAIVTIADDGPGIPVDSRALALRRFGRLEASRSRPGHGLGLPLIGAIVRLHGGDLTLVDGEPGLTLRLAFPMHVRS